jgi:uncharacterized membrane protein YcaP (DUF421 family)
MPVWFETVWRSLLAVAVLLVMAKLIGKRQITQLSIFEFIAGIAIGNLVAYVSLNASVYWYLGLLSLIVWAGAWVGLQYLSMKSKIVRDAVDGKGTIFIKEGKLLEDNLKKEKLTLDDLLGQLRKKNVFRVADVEFAVMESSGDINVLLKREHQPLTPNHLGIKVGPEQEPQTVIMDGKIMDEPLSTIGLNRRWLFTELEKMGLAAENIFLGQVDTYGQLYVDVFDDKLKVPSPQSKAALLATLKKCEADLEMFALSTKAEEAKAMYTGCSGTMEQIINDLKPILKS